VRARPGEVERARGSERTGWLPSSGADVDVIDLASLIFASPPATARITDLAPPSTRRSILATLDTRASIWPPNELVYVVRMTASSP